MSTQIVPLSPTIYGVFACLACREDGACGDHCSASWPEAIPPTWSDYWPSCTCCKRPAHLIEVLTRQEG
jgi:hypothetical protein